MPSRLISLDDLATRVRAAPPRAGRTRVLAVDGRAGSGKSTLAQRLARPLDAPTVHMDDLYPGWDGLADAVPRLVEWVLAPLARRELARYRRFDWHRDEYAEWVELPRSGVVVVEGCGSGSRDAAPYLAYLIWVEAPSAVRMRRGVGRDGETFRPHWERWAAQEDVLYAAERTRERADLRVDGHGLVPHDPGREVVQLGWGTSRQHDPRW